jgi:pilus assembly protein CpaB
MAIAAILGVAAAIVGYYGLNGIAARAAAGTGNTYQDVVVTTSDLTYGVKFERGMLALARYPKNAVPMGAFSSIDSVVGQTTKVFMGAREPVTSIKLSSRGGGLSMLVRPTMRAASIEVNQVSGVSGFVLPGDKVDVLVTVEPRGSLENAVTRTLLQNVEILAAGQKTQQKDGNPMTVQSVTLLVDPSGAEKIALATHEGEIHLVLRNPEDQEQVAVTSFSTREILGGSPPPAPRSDGGKWRPAPAPSVSRQMGDGKVRIIRSAEVTETPVVPDSSAR